MPTRASAIKPEIKRKGEKAKRKVAWAKARSNSMNVKKATRYKQALAHSSVSIRRTDSGNYDYTISSGHTGSKIRIGMMSEDPIFTAERWSRDVFPK